ncbi:MAG: hypothetical protein R2847_02745 [Bacteroidia bacterium]
MHSAPHKPTYPTVCLLFYTNGCWIANATGCMMNGDSLNPDNFSDGYCPLWISIANMELALPVPGMMNK